MPDQKQFDPEIYLKVLHDQSSLKDFEKHVSKLNNDLRANRMNTDLAKKLVESNFETYFEAKKAFDIIEKRIINEYDFFQ